MSKPSRAGNWGLAMDGTKYLQVAVLLVIGVAIIAGNVYLTFTVHYDRTPRRR